MSSINDTTTISPDTVERILDDVKVEHEHADVKVEHEHVDVKVEHENADVKVEHGLGLDLEGETAATSTVIEAAAVKVEPVEAEGHPVKVETDVVKVEEEGDVVVKVEGEHGLGLDFTAATPIVKVETEVAAEPVEEEGDVVVKVEGEHGLGLDFTAAAAAAPTPIVEVETEVAAVKYEAVEIKEETAAVKVEEEEDAAAAAVVEEEEDAAAAAVLEEEEDAAAAAVVEEEEDAAAAAVVEEEEDAPELPPTFRYNARRPRLSTIHPEYHLYYYGSAYADVEFPFRWCLKLNFDLVSIRREAIGRELVRTIAGIRVSEGILLLPGGLDEVAVTFTSDMVIVMFRDHRSSFKICSLGAADRCFGWIFDDVIGPGRNAFSNQRDDRRHGIHYIYPMSVSRIPGAPLMVPWSQASRYGPISKILVDNQVPVVPFTPIVRVFYFRREDQVRAIANVQGHIQHIEGPIRAIPGGSPDDHEFKPWSIFDLLGRSAVLEIRAWARSRAPHPAAPRDVKDEPAAKRRRL